MFSNLYNKLGWEWLNIEYHLSKTNGDLLFLYKLKSESAIFSPKFPLIAKSSACLSNILYIGKINIFKNNIIIYYT